MSGLQENGNLGLLSVNETPNSGAWGPNLTWPHLSAPFFYNVSLDSVPTSQGNYTACLASGLSVQETCCQKLGGQFVEAQNISGTVTIVNTTESHDGTNVHWCQLPYYPLVPTNKTLMTRPKLFDNVSLSLFEFQSCFLDTIPAGANTTADKRTNTSAVWQCTQTRYIPDQQGFAPVGAMYGSEAYSNPNASQETDQPQGSAGEPSKTGTKLAVVGALALVLPALIATIA